ncbi:50S ribosomal protein L4 [Candidatus Uhrbacteria bacterium CG22_combo_CG10-13_8_21_14_all_47_17]|uniref:Large ribosomal subunit protein uL4 n=1 Tax=Candidatus Uhrbacteria bacterium CG22_combo_CG10-13_8_21_14_all_47_17 TaxID=1975041 RepID=A0A2H0BT08_9BACT|nr:MAG: 50S ribosomal protein L4 [Candidatus Uhrbacteria bacterium CG22_combo_CG10-13_8_21_14_all_47_17]
MPKISVYNQEGKTVGELNLNDALFGVKANTALVHEAVVAQRANARQVLAHTKTRGEVRGGGRKPWKQKGTGRARQGSIRSPQWIGGGVVFGPSKDRNFSVKINRKAKRQALFMALSDKIVSEKLVVLDSVSTEPTKTKFMAEVLKKLPIDRTVLFIAPASSPLLMRMVRNLPHVKLVTANSVNLLDVLSYRSIVFLKDAVEAFDKIYT